MHCDEIPGIIVLFQDIKLNSVLIYLILSFSSPPKATTVLIEDKTSVAMEDAFKYIASVLALVVFVAWWGIKQSVR